MLIELWRKICRVHCSDDGTACGAVYDFMFPRLTGGFLIRSAVITVAALLLFGVFLTPCVISGASMEPTVHSVGLTFCWRWKYSSGKSPQRGDIVVIKYADKVFYLKRIVALPGETVEFRDGELYVNGIRQNEPYVKFVSTWNLPPRKVAPGHYYAVGDNRSMPIEQHKFGQVSGHRIIGAPIW